MFFILTISSGYGALALSVLHFVLAMAVSCHVLLTKRDVGSAIGWIGLAWLSPYLGVVFYLLLGINRVKRRASNLRRPVMRSIEAAHAGGPIEDRLKRLEVAGHRITRRPIEAGNRLVLHRNGDETYPLMLAAIRSASRSIGLTSYIFRDDSAGAPLIDALIEAHRRGVAVRVIIDGIGGGYFHNAAHARLRRAGVPAELFMHSTLPWRMPFLNLRSHKKILIADGRLAFTGGLNIGDENVLASRPAHPVRDTHCEVRGPVTGQIAEVFAEDWLFVSGETLSGEAWFPSLQTAGPLSARVVTSGPDQDVQKIEWLLLQAIATAEHSIRIATPYFLPDDRIVTALALAALRGITVDILFPERSNRLLVDWARDAHVGPLVTAGCRLWATAPPFEHSKITVIDSVWCMIGSANFDMRSLRLNFELNVEAYGTEFVDTVNAALDRFPKRRFTHADLSATLPARLRNNAARLLLPYL